MVLFSNIVSAPNRTSPGMERTVAMINRRRDRPTVNKAERSSMVKQIKNSSLGKTGGAVVRTKLAIGMEKISIARAGL